MQTKLTENEQVAIRSITNYAECVNNILIKKYGKSSARSKTLIHQVVGNFHENSQVLVAVKTVIKNHLKDLQELTVDESLLTKN